MFRGQRSDAAGRPGGDGNRDRSGGGAVAERCEQHQRGRSGSRRRVDQPPDPWQSSDQELLDALRAHRFELKPTAAALGIARSTTLYKIVAKNPRIRKAGDLDRSEIEAAVDKSGGDLTATPSVLEVSRQGLKRRMKVLGLR